MNSKEKYLNLIEALAEVINIETTTPESTAEKYIAVSTLLAEMHNLLQLDRALLLDEVTALRARLDADSPIGTIRSN